MIEWAISVYADIVKVAFPVAVVFELGNLMVSTILRVGFGGKLWLGK